MPGVFEFDELDMTGMNFDTVGWGGEVIRKSLGGGRGVSALVGNVGGLHRWALSAGVLPGDDDYGNLVDGTNRFDYYFDFFREHTTGDQEVFIIEWRNKKYHAAFTEPSIEFEVFTSDLFAGGVSVEQRTVEGSIYNDDGSLFWPALDITGVTGWYPVLAADASSDTVYDQSSYGRNLTCSAPRPDRTTNGGVNVLRWNGTDDNPYLGSGSIAYTHAFIVGCATDAAFAAYRSLLGGGAADVLLSENTGTKFGDVGYGASFQYRKNGTDLADNNALCSMSGVLAILEAEFTSALTPGVILGNDASSGSKWKGDVAHALFINNAALTSAQKTLIRQFLSVECGGTITVV